MKKNTSYSEMLRHENELTRLKIQAEFGVDLKGTDALNPAIENIWLKQILDYENNKHHNKRVTVRELLGNPQLKKNDEVSDNDLCAALQEVMDLLYEKRIIVESTDGADDRELYRFITEELMLTETDTHTLPNMITYFIYEEFHPNDEADIRRGTEDFLKSICKAYLDRCLSELWRPQPEEEEEINRLEKLKRRLLLFVDAFEEIDLESFQIRDLKIDEDAAEVAFDFSFSVRTVEAASSYPIVGDGRLEFIRQMGYWFVSEVDLPGVV